MHPPVVFALMIGIFIGAGTTLAVQQRSGQSFAVRPYSEGRAELGRMFDKELPGYLEAGDAERKAAKAEELLKKVVRIARDELEIKVPPSAHEFAGETKTE